MSTPPHTPLPPRSPDLLDSPPRPASPIVSSRDGRWFPGPHQHEDSNDAPFSRADGQHSAFAAVLRFNNDDNTENIAQVSQHQTPTLQQAMEYRNTLLSVLEDSNNGIAILHGEAASESEGTISVLNEDAQVSQHQTPMLQQAMEYVNTLLSVQEDSNTASESEGTISLLNEDSTSTVVSAPGVTVTVPVLNEGSNNALDSGAVSEASIVTRVVGRRSKSPEEEPPAKVRKLSNSSEEADGESCPICLEPWGNAGDHRLVALKCGHLFGSKCVERWLRAQPARERACPTCKSRAALKDLRFIYARRLVAVDTAELSALQARLRDLQAEKHRTELELYQSQLARRACQEQMEALQASLRPLQGSLRAPGAPPRRRHWRFALEKNLEMVREGGCRVLAYNSRSYDLYVSQKSTSSLFPGWGVRKVSCVDFRPGQFTLLHPRAIRDVAYSPVRDTLLSVALDGSAKVWQRGAASLSLPTGAPLWAATWDSQREHELYVGGVGGVVLQYDIRSPAHPLSRLQSHGGGTPVVALHSTSVGLLSCTLDTCTLWRPTSCVWTPETLPVEGPFISMAYDEPRRRALLSCRGRAGAQGRLIVCRLAVDGTCAVEQTFPHSSRSSVMCRAAWVSAGGAAGGAAGGGACWAAAHAESDAALKLHPVDGALPCSLPAEEPALDVRAVSLNGDTILAALSDSRLRLYKAIANES